ncbi:MAG: tetratricopeptide repeat protein [Candidatus Sumerlaeota bacterium]
MDVDKLVEEALECLEDEEYERARQLLKQAATVAPLRTDIRNYLQAAIARKPVDSSGIPDIDAESAAAESGSGSAVKHHLVLIFSLIILMLLLAGLAVGGWWLATHDGGLSDIIPGAKVTPTPSPTPDPLSTEQRKMLTDARAYADAGNYAEAVKAMDAFLNTAPPQPDLYASDAGQWNYEAAMENYKNRDYSAAIARARRAIELSDDVPEYHFLVGQILFRRGRLSSGSERREDLEAARQALTKTTELDPEYLKAYDILAKTQIALGDKMEGVQTYYKIIQTAPDSPEARQAQDDLKDMGVRLPE